MQPANLPNFYILGVTKAGTSSLYAYLKQHPQVYLPEAKEPHFFNIDLNYAEGLEKYLRRHFAHAASYPARGEATASYLSRYEDVIPRMAPLYDGAPPRFIVIMRDPVARAWSHYLHRIRNGWETESFERALELEESRLRAKSSEWWVGYFSEGLYAQQLEIWFEHFPRDRFLFLLTDDLARDAGGTMRRMFEFLGVDPSIEVDTGFKENTAAAPRSKLLGQFLGRPSPIKAPLKAIVPRRWRSFIKKPLNRLNQRAFAEPPKLDPDIARMLRARYADEIVRLERIIDRDLSHWLQR